MKTILKGVGDNVHDALKGIRDPLKGVYDPWPTNVREARKVQEALMGRLRITPLKKPPSLIASLDAAFLGERVIGAACLFSYPGLEKLEEAFSVMRCSFPYIPGYLSFREGPVLIEALGKLHGKPGLVILDGQGIAHPRGMGIASHLGVVLRMPSIGCAKSRLVGEFKEPGRRKGQWSPLILNGKTVGAVLRTREAVRPVFVSPGHGIDLEGAIEIVMGCTGKFRIPEPLRCADRAAGRLKKVI
jgi:deoxyribonuclease V